MTPERQAQFEGSSVLITCTGENVQWLKDDKPLHQSQLGIRSVLDVLFIQNSKNFHSGIYTCLSQDKDGIDQMGTSQLFIGGKPRTM